MNSKTQKKIICALATIALTITYIALGFAVCAGLPLTTQFLASQTINSDASPYTSDELVSLALQTRDFTVNDYGRSDGGSEAAQNTLAEAVIEKAHEASSSSSLTADRWSDEALAALSADTDGLSPAEIMQNLSEAGQQYALDNDAISHLNDVNAVVSSVMFPIAGIAVLAAFFLMYSILTYGVSSIRRPLKYSGIATVCIFAFIGLWAFISFDAFFATLHSLFFAQGSWLFSADSLLITMYPQGFWMGMGIVWLAVSVILSLLSIDFAFLLKKRLAEKDDSLKSGNDTGAKTETATDTPSKTADDETVLAERAQAEREQTEREQTERAQMDPSESL